MFEYGSDHIAVVGPTGKAVQPMFSGYQVPRMQGGDENSPAWVIVFVDDSNVVKVKWREDCKKNKALIASLEDAQFQEIRERREEEEP